MPARERQLLGDELPQRNVTGEWQKEDRLSPMASIGMSPTRGLADVRQRLWAFPIDLGSTKLDGPSAITLLERRIA